MTKPDPDLRRLRLAIIFVFGLPSMVIGIFLYASYVWRQLKKKDAL
jgi:hypothetical protein